VGISVYGSGGFGEVFDTVENAHNFSVVDGDFYRSGEAPPVSHGSSLVDASWRHDPRAGQPTAKPESARE
jgi:hypothetical protein